MRMSAKARHLAAVKARVELAGGRGWTVTIDGSRLGSYKYFASRGAMFYAASSVDDLCEQIDHHRRPATKVTKRGKSAELLAAETAVKEIVERNCKRP